MVTPWEKDLQLGGAEMSKQSGNPTAGFAEHPLGEKKEKPFKEQSQASKAVIQVILNYTGQNVAPPQCCANLTAPSHTEGGTA